MRNFSTAADLKYGFGIQVNCGFVRFTRECDRGPMGNGDRQ